MNQNFEEVFNEIKNLETTNKQKLNRVKQDARKFIENCSEQKNSERLEKIKRINSDIENYYVQEKEKIEKSINLKKLEIEKQVLDLRANFEQKKEQAVNELFSEFLS